MDWNAIKLLQTTSILVLQMKSNQNGVSGIDR